MNWRDQYEREVEAARENLRKVWAKQPRYAFLARAIEESGVGEFVVSADPGTYGSDWIRLDVPDFAMVEPLREWLGDNGHPAESDPVQEDTHRTYYHGRIFIMAYPPKDDDETSEAPCRAVQIGTKWVVPEQPEPYEQPIYKIICDDMLEAHDEDA